MNPAIDLENAKVFFGSCLDVLPTLADNSVDAIVTDPPYELGFMGKTWDNSGIAYNVDVWKECLRVLKPGGHILAFGGSRTWHRLAVAIEDSGFEMRDSIAWLYGSGFPKSHNISKAIDKLHGAERTVMGRNPNSRENATKNNTLYESGTVGKTDFITASATDDAKKWDGWGTALKPAFEPIVVGRKPLVGTVAENVLEWGVGGLNIDATRIGTETVTINTFDNGAKPFGDAVGEPFTSRESVGRWPANIILDEYTAELLDEQSGITKSGKAGIRTSDGFNANAYGSGVGIKAGQANGEFGDSGGASRFFYVAKANKKDRNEGLDDLVAQESAGKGNGLGRLCAICGASILKPCECPDRTFVNPPKQNFHPTVKPTALMQYLVRLVTPEGGTVLDPFTGSGSTGKAAILENKQFIGIELTEEYLPIIAGRLEHAINTSEEKEDDLFASL
jgi:site-specific DNA-methyltransferase (adenine-specific)